MKSKTAIAVGIALVSGAAMACTMKAMPPLVVKVSLLDVAVAVFRGYDNPSRAAALLNLDEAASSAGVSDWQATNYKGSVTYRVGNGVNIVTEDKPCDKKAIDMLEDPDEDEDADEHGENGGSGSSSGGYYWFSYRIYGSGGTCFYNCGGIVTVGEVDPQ
jgi:hypothetical protein